MPPIIAELNPNNAYIRCPQCRDAGTPNVNLMRPDQTGKLQCQFGHVYQSWAQLQMSNPEMVPMSEVFHEQPNPEAMKYSFFVMPRTMERLKQRYPQNLMTTVATMLDALADGSVMFLQGSEVLELKKRGLKNGPEILAALESVKSLEQQRETAVRQLEQLQNMLKQAGVTE